MTHPRSRYTAAQLLLDLLKLRHAALDLRDTLPPIDQARVEELVADMSRLLFAMWAESGCQ